MYITNANKLEMKKIALLLCYLLMIASCGSDDSTPPETNQTDNPDPAVNAELSLITELENRVFWNTIIFEWTATGLENLSFKIGDISYSDITKDENRYEVEVNTRTLDNGDQTVTIEGVDQNDEIKSLSKTFKINNNLLEINLQGKANRVFSSSLSEDRVSKYSVLVSGESGEVLFYKELIDDDSFIVERPEGYNESRYYMTVFSSHKTVSESSARYSGQVIPLDKYDVFTIEGFSEESLPRESKRFQVTLLNGEESGEYLITSSGDAPFNFYTSASFSSGTTQQSKYVRFSQELNESELYIHYFNPQDGSSKYYYQENIKENDFVTVDLTSNFLIGDVEVKIPELGENTKTEFILGEVSDNNILEKKAIINLTQTTDRSTPNAKVTFPSSLFPRVGGKLANYRDVEPYDFYLESYFTNKKIPVKDDFSYDYPYGVTIMHNENFSILGDFSFYQVVESFSGTNNTVGLFWNLLPNTEYKLPDFKMPEAIKQDVGLENLTSREDRVIYWLQRLKLNGEIIDGLDAVKESVLFQDDFDPIWDEKTEYIHYL